MKMGIRGPHFHMTPVQFRDRDTIVPSGAGQARGSDYTSRLYCIVLVRKWVWLYVQMNVTTTIGYATLSAHNYIV